MIAAVAGILAGVACERAGAPGAASAKHGDVAPSVSSSAPRAETHACGDHDGGGCGAPDTK